MSVVVAVRELSRFEPLTADMLTLAEWPAETPPVGAFTSVEALLGAEPVVNVPAGHLIDDFIVPDYALDGMNDILAADLPDRNILLNQNTGYEVLAGLPNRTQFTRLVDSMPAFRTLLQSTYPQMILAPDDTLLTAEQADALQADDEAMLTYLRDHIYSSDRMTVEIPDDVSVASAVGLEGGGAVLLLDALVLPVPTVEIALPVQNELVAGLSAGDRVTVLVTNEVTDADGSYQTSRLIESAIVAASGADDIRLNVTFEEAERLRADDFVSYSVLPLEAERDVIDLDVASDNWISVPVDPGMLADIRLGDLVSIGLSYEGEMNTRTWIGSGMVLNTSSDSNDRLPPTASVDHRLARSVTLLLPEGGAAIIRDLAEGGALLGASVTRQGLEVTQVGRQILFQAGEPGSCGPQDDYVSDSSFFTLPLATSNFTVERDYEPYQPGVQISVDSGTPVLAASAGRVIFAGQNNFGYGNMIVLNHGDRLTVYAHLDEVRVMCGALVRTGNIIGTSGESGNITKPGLYFEVRERGTSEMPDAFTPVDPVELIEQLG